VQCSWNRNAKERRWKERENIGRKGKVGNWCPEGRGESSLDSILATICSLNLLVPCWRWLFSWRNAQQNVKSLQDENESLTEMLQSYDDLKFAQQQKKSIPSPASRAGPARGALIATIRGRGLQAPNRGASIGPNLKNGERRSKNLGSWCLIVDKTELILLFLKCNHNQM